MKVFIYLFAVDQYHQAHEIKFAVAVVLLANFSYFSVSFLLEHYEKFPEIMKFNTSGLEMLLISLQAQKILPVCHAYLPLLSNEPFHSSRLCVNAIEAERDHCHQEFLNR